MYCHFDNKLIDGVTYTLIQLTITSEFELTIPLPAISFKAQTDI